MSLPQMENLFSTQTYVLEQGQSPIITAPLILKTVTVQTYLSSWGKFVKSLKILSFLDEV